MCSAFNTRQQERMEKSVRFLYMVDVVCSTKPTIRVNGEDIPHKIVKSTFLKLNSSHIEYILTAMSKNTSDVRNIRSYLITALYNAPATMNSFWSAMVNHDMVGS